MDFITPQNRHQIKFASMEDKITADNRVRLVAAFVEYVELVKLHFVVPTLKSEGRPSVIIVIYSNLLKYAKPYRTCMACFIHFNKYHDHDELILK